jgi:alkanesulfonate monooxygenase SsuD/methylene tetrahydromethanopterin reductase-like flavin-dependent oxidoreductase (luciferase family)
MSLKYGVNLPQVGGMMGISNDPVEAVEAMIRVAQTAEECGYETLWLGDHFMPLAENVQGAADWFECWTSMAALARETTRIRLGQTVTCNGYRNPALLARKSCISGEASLGSGLFL